MQKYVNILIHSIKMEKCPIFAAVSSHTKRARRKSCHVYLLNYIFVCIITYVCPSVCMDIHIIKPRTQTFIFRRFQNKMKCGCELYVEI